MRFACEGKTYDTDDMIVLGENLGYARGIYITPDFKCVFACYMGHDGISIVPVQGEALRMLAESLKHPELLRAMDVAIQTTT